MLRLELPALQSLLHQDAPAVDIGPSAHAASMYALHKRTDIMSETWPPNVTSSTGCSKANAAQRAGALLNMQAPEVME